MNYNMYTIYDLKTEAFHKPFYANADGEALRMIYSAALDEKTMFHSNPEDFQLYAIGYFNDQLCKVTIKDKIFLGTILSIAQDMEKTQTLKQRLEK